ncbi:alpha/beta fold hydrolase [Paenarthrobacter nicotinovorans]|uniref:alpha/beta fold hydrolase n=1 Tax=Paenarthrobacter nicotinovorans TaxID=29320 RepID=UPI003D672AFA
MKFVLVHGAWHYGEMWDPVRTHLEAAGHEVHTPTAGGLGPNDSKYVNLNGAAEPIIEYIREHNLSDFVLVGHSWGGYLISRVAIEMPERIRRLVYFAAFVPEHGKALVDEVPPHLRAALQASADERSDGSVVLPFFVWRDGFFNDGSAEHAQEIYDVLRPQPFGAFTDPADMTGWERVPQAFSYIAPLDDNDITQGEWGRHPRLSNRLGVFRLVSMEGCHEVLLTNPGYTALKFIEAGRD